LKKQKEESRNNYGGADSSMKTRDKPGDNSETMMMNTPLDQAAIEQSLTFTDN